MKLRNIYKFMNRDNYYPMIVCGTDSCEKYWEKKPDERCEFIYKPLSEGGVAHLRFMKSNKSQAEDFWCVDLRGKK